MGGAVSPLITAAQWRALKALRPLLDPECYLGRERTVALIDP